MYEPLSSIKLVAVTIVFTLEIVASKKRPQEVKDLD